MLHLLSLGRIVLDVFGLCFILSMGIIIKEIRRFKKESAQPRAVSASVTTKTNGEVRPDPTTALTEPATE